MPVNLIALSVPIFFILIGIELWYSRRRGVSVYRFNDSVTDIACGTGQQIVGVFLKALLFGTYAWVYEHWRFVTFPDGSAWPWVIAFFGVDLAYYWWHRASHEIAFMWAIHVVHHQSEDYNLAVALRQAWFSGTSSILFYLPLALAGVPVVPFVTMYALSTLYQYWIHTRLIGKLGPIELVMNTASHHRVHHGRDDKYLDRNYAATLIVWDRLFGSFQEEEEEPKYGVVHPYASWNPVWANFEVWQQLFAKARTTPKFADKIRCFVKRPGWVPPGGVSEPSEVASEPRVRFATPASRPVTAYVAFQFVPVTAGTVWLISRPAGAATPEMLGLAVLLLLATVVWGGLFEAKPWAVPLEIARLAAIALAAAAVAVIGGAGWLIPTLVGLAVVVSAAMLTPLIAGADLRSGRAEER